MKRRLRRGLALPVAMLTVTIVVLFVAGSAFATSQESRASVGALAERLALETAEYGAVALLRDWDPAWNVVTPVGQTLGPFTHALSGGAVASVRLTRASWTTWWAVSDGNTGGAVTREARRSVSAVFRLDMPAPVIDAALAVTDSVRVTGTGTVVGTDSVEFLATCLGLPPVPIAGIAAPDPTKVTGLGGVTGAPPVITDATVAQSLASLDSALTPDIIIPAGAIVTPAPAFAAGICDTAATTNWGDPAGGACGAHLPVIKALGDLTVRGGVGQGILIVDGDVVFENGASFAGLVMVSDDFVTGAGGGSVSGAVIAGDVRRGAGDHTIVGSGGHIRRSSCRLRQARLAAADPVRAKHRWWAEFDR